MSTWSDPVVIASLGGQAVLIIGAIFEGTRRIIRALRVVNTTAGLAATAATSAASQAATAVDKAQTADLKLDQIHEKADHAIAQNEKIEEKTNGNLAEMRALLLQYKAQLDAKDVENATLRDQIERLLPLLKADPTTVVSKPGGRRADDSVKHDHGDPPHR